MAEKRRTYRVAERIRELLAQELLQLADPRFNLVTITSVVTSADLRHAKVYWVVPDASITVGQGTAALSNGQSKNGKPALCASSPSGDRSSNPAAGSLSEAEVAEELEAQHAEIADAFRHAEGPLRKMLARGLGTRFVPELKFFYDDTYDTVHRVEELLERVSRSLPSTSSDGESPEGETSDGPDRGEKE
jgi:ribosome-binding factor A